ncbi:hypothetical protein HELRODRAFT_78950 [Helobdella robusta]|uniref:H/ACA ribonucleoprotein complex subunit 2 n=1 Tax=Helobdella robusta TaxID=6412 RepID=T1G3H6_HELRO|nr:hypothetical protein HELRODRAFT_78950 [Helobdella robusta]ESO04566.1 hypothetical protein HELRODRAFT_78950 [Helobdella robusta]
MVDNGGKVDWDELVNRCQIIANPLASRKLTKKIYKVIKKAQKAKHLRKGIKDVQKCLRKGEKGLIILAGDTHPIDVIAHLPIVCEEFQLPYCYVPSKEALGEASGSKRQTCAMLIKQHGDYKELYQECVDAVSSLPLPL